MEEDIRNMAGSDGVSIHAGFPNPALDHRGRTSPLALDLNQILIRHPSSTYLFRISGHLWADQGIYDGDIALIDRAVTVQAACLVLSWQVGGFILSRYSQISHDDQIWGVVIAIIHQYNDR